MLDLKAQDLWGKVEGLREELYDVVDGKGINSPEAIQVRRNLDEKVNEYYRLKEWAIRLTEIAILNIKKLTMKEVEKEVEL
ncbi:MAG: Sporulation stage 0, Spo0E-like regulatory phosphatase [Firmicutes bacterium]|nr:Sporulation stage 0, Spo0E-like regulatory phosphatase [Bacillota bacterium]